MTREAKLNKIGTELIAQLKKAKITSAEQAASLTNERLMQLLLKTKKACCFAESEVENGNWTNAEFAILSAITTSVPVTMFADAKWGKGNADSYAEPQQGHLFFTNGPVLDPNSPISKSPNSEYYQLTKPENGQRVLDQDKYKAFFRQRLLPIFKEAQNQATKQGKTAFVSIPGIGCGAFAGTFDYQLKNDNGDGAFKDAVYAVLKELTNEEFSGVVRIDMGPDYQQNKTVILETNNLHVYEYDQGANGLGITAQPSTLGIAQKEGLTDKDFLYFTVVAGDPASYPGNDMQIDSSWTNEGAVGGSTNVVGLSIGIEGAWNPVDKEYQPKDKKGWIQHNHKPYVAAENPVYDTVTIPAKAVAPVAAASKDADAAAPIEAAKKTTPNHNFRFIVPEETWGKVAKLRKMIEDALPIARPLNGKGRVIVAILSMLTLGIYPLARYLRSLATGEIFSWGLPNSMYATRPLQVPTSSSAVTAKATEPRSIVSQSQKNDPRARTWSFFSGLSDNCGLEKSKSKCQK